MTDEKRYRRSEDVAWRIIEDIAVIVTPHDGKIHQLNETGTCLWMALDAPSTPDSLADALCEEFDVDSETALSHVKDFIESLTEKRIVAED